MKIIGLTGGIATGKSTVSKCLRQLGGTVIDADIVAREIVEKGEPALKEIIDFFGKEVVDNNGNLKRKELGSIVFSDPEKLQVLNNITHRKIIKKIEDKIEYYRHLNNLKAIFIDAALLIEMKMYILTDEIWLVDTNRETQLKRLMLRDNLSVEKAMDRIKAQMSLEQKRKYADIIINNTKDFDYLKKQVEDLYNKI
ncbi:dephospho-CoA kinase [Maledivibacter halophilus]|uniref:Dephospho-CoA kinase n=1 Tax=Maledivibacter halophilus TaxID=36842 RepID=A0A1T5KKQ6_9FIRM|nr:dephospho-CoA kinase [Maledivibacter halophilus]SKC64253.1 dephospho-CoA kinase [Maledivibacter halophilus]